MCGGKEVGDIDDGYGPARGFLAAETARIRNALAAIDDEELRQRCDPADMTAKTIYPDIWLRPQEEEDPHALLIDMTEGQGHAMNPGHPPFGDEAAFAVDDLQPNPLAGGQRPGAAQGEPALRDVGRIGRVPLDLAGAPVAQFDAPGKPAVDTAFHVVE